MHERANLLIGLPQEALQADQHTLYIVDGAPLVLKNVQAYSSTKINIRMVYRRPEKHVRSLVRIVGRELEGQAEVHVCVRRVARPGDCGGPVKEVVGIGGKCGDAGGG